MNGYSNILRADERVSMFPNHAVSDARRAPIRIWMVDDNDGFRVLLASILNEEPGFECSRHFSSPAAVLKALSCEDPPDIILLDIEMGDANGLDAIRPIKSLAGSTHVLMLTTFAMPGARERAFREGASDFMLKTWSIPEISMHIRQAMEFGSVAGLLTAYLGTKPAVKEPEIVEVVEKSSRLERGFGYLRGLLKFGTS